jgi:hypothetical protein
VAFGAMRPGEPADKVIEAMGAEDPIEALRGLVTSDAKVLADPSPVTGEDMLTMPDPFKAGDLIDHGGPYRVIKVEDNGFLLIVDTAIEKRWVNPHAVQRAPAHWAFPELRSAEAKVCRTCQQPGCAETFDRCPAEAPKRTHEASPGFVCPACAWPEEHEPELQRLRAEAQRRESAAPAPPDLGALADQYLRHDHPSRALLEHYLADAYAMGRRRESDPLTGAELAEKHVLATIDKDKKGKKG